MDEDGAPVSLLGYGAVFRAALRPDPDDGSGQVEFAVDASQAASGRVTFTLSASETRLLARPVYRLEVEADDDPANADGPLTLLLGRAQVMEDAFR